MVCFGAFAVVGASPSEADVDAAEVSDGENSEAEVVELVLFDSQLWEASPSGFSSSKVFCCSCHRL